MAVAHKPQTTALPGSIAETVTRNQLTDVGIIAGTLPYMAPEQLEVDARTDIWGFGCVLYEMVTGRRTFGGATPASLIGMILDRHPPPPSTVEPTAGGALDRVIQKCLAKDPEARWQTAQDLRDELKWIGRGVAAVPAGGVHAALRWRHVVTGAAIGATLASGALLVLQPWRSPPSEPTVSRLKLTIPRLGSPDSLAVSPDGRQLAFIAPDPQGRQCSGCAAWQRRRQGRFQALKGHMRDVTGEVMGGTGALTGRSLSAPAGVEGLGEERVSACVGKVPRRRPVHAVRAARRPPSTPASARLSGGAVTRRPAPVPMRATRTQPTVRPPRWTSGRRDRATAAPQ